MIQIEDINEVEVGSIIYAPGHINTSNAEFTISNVYLRVISIQTIVIKSVDEFTTDVYKYNVYDEHLKFTHTESFQQALVERRILKGGWFYPDFENTAEEAKTLLALE